MFAVVFDDKGNNALIVFGYGASKLLKPVVVITLSHSRLERDA